MCLCVGERGPALRNGRHAACGRQPCTWSPVSSAAPPSASQVLAYEAGHIAVNGVLQAMHRSICARAAQVLAYEAGRKYNVRVNAISAGPLGSRAAKAIGFIDDMIRWAGGVATLPAAGRAARPLLWL